MPDFMLEPNPVLYSTYTANILSYELNLNHVPEVFSRSMDQVLSLDTKPVAGNLLSTAPPPSVARGL